MPTVLVVAALHVQMTLLLWHNPLLRPVELTLIEVSALVIAMITATVLRVRKCGSTIWQTVKLLPIGVFVVQLLDKL